MNSFKLIVSPLVLLMAIEACTPSDVAGGAPGASSDTVAAGSGSSGSSGTTNACSAYTTSGKTYRDLTFAGANTNNLVFSSSSCDISVSYCGAVWRLPSGLTPAMSSWQAATITVVSSNPDANCLSVGSHSCQVIVAYDSGLAKNVFYYNCPGYPQESFIQQ